MTDSGLDPTSNGDRKITHETVYDSLYASIISGHFEPGKALTIRGLAQELGVSPMPVREAISRLVALGALEIWLQFGPFMRIVLGRLGTSLLVDQHVSAINALRNNDEQALREAIRLDIYDGMDRIGLELLGHASSQ